MNEPISSGILVARMRELLADPQARETYLPALSGAQSDAIATKLSDVVGESSAWVHRFACLDDRTILPASVLKIAQLLDLPVKSIATSVKWEVWVFAVDDLLDERRLPFGEIEQILEECYGIAISPVGVEQPHTEFGVSFTELKRELADHPQFVGLQPSFAAATMKLFEGMMYVAQSSVRWADTSPSPPLDEYLYHAANGHVHPFFWTLPLVDDASVLPELSALASLAHVCARICRLANDLGTFARERDEGVLNAVRVVMNKIASQEIKQSSEDLLQAAEGEIRARMEHERGRAEDLAAGIHTDSGVERSFLRLAELTVGTYGRGDVRNWKERLGLISEAALSPGSG
jgi:hypothetical protein